MHDAFLAVCAQVETPVVRTLINGAPAPELPNRTGGGGRPGENTSDITCFVARAAVSNATSVRFTSLAGTDAEISVQSSYLPPADFIIQYARIMLDLLSTIFQEVLQLPVARLCLVYMTTIRADTAVAVRTAWTC